tara:strand:+ start:25 stop:546 length:522 start_codon:yes stop_codon:yes gene_type:complete
MMGIKTQFWKYQFITLIGICLMPVLVWGYETKPMDKTIDRFYINYNHPIIRQGKNLLGTIILQNNNPEGFLLKLVSSNGGMLKTAGASDGESDFNYAITFEQGTGEVGGGVTTDYSESEMLTDHVIYQTNSQQTATDVALKVYLEIDGEISEYLMAGKYRDEIELVYLNNNPL